MKNLTKFLVIAILGIALSVTSFAQGVSTSATATATIIAPISITKTADLAFGNIAVGALSGGTCTVTNGGVKSFGGTCSGPLTGATAASFTIAGTNGATFSITLPASVSLAGGLPNMTLDTWDNSLGVGPVFTLTAASVTLNLGGVLHVAAAQPTGAYTGTINVTVGYN